MNQLSKAIQLVLFVAMLNFATTLASAQVIKAGRVERVVLHGKSLEGNLAGDSPDREVSVYLPPGYASNPSKRYPVVYYLHGFTDDDAQWYGLKKHWINFPAILDTAYSKDKVKECIFVTPNGFTKFFGSWYSNSVVTGNWEEFIAKELVGYIDKRYRTIQNSAARALAGHSMGGYGTMRIAQKYPEVFSSFYLLSPAIFIPGTTHSAPLAELEQIKTFDDLQKAPFWTKGIFSQAAAWSPNPNKPPFYVDLPGQDSTQQVKVLTKWAANLPLASLDQNVGNLRKFRGIAFDCGDQDVNFANAIRVLDAELNKYNIKHEFEIYPGDHLNKVGARIRHYMLPFFSKNFSIDAQKINRK